jgi:hypothetical protein
MNKSRTHTSPSTATRLARLRAFLDSNGNLRLSRTLEKLAIGQAPVDELITLNGFLEAEAPVKLLRDFLVLWYPVGLVPANERF